MHIVFDARIHLNHITGISRYIIHLLKELLQINSGNTYTILINGNLKEDDDLILLVKSFHQARLEIVPLPHFGPTNYLQMPAIIKKLNPDIYHYPHLDAPIIPGIRTVATIHDTNFKKGIKKYNDRFGIKTSYFKWAIHNTVKKADHLIFVSEAVRNEILIGKDENFKAKASVIYNGIESDFGKISTEELQLVKLKFQLPEKYFLYVGQLREHKNIERVIEAYNQLNQNDYQLILVGYNYPKNKININFLGVRYLGMVTEIELKAIYKLSSCFVFPSLIEGFGLPLLEAMSCNTPVITSNQGATKEIAGEAAILVNPFNSNDIHDAMLRIISDKVLQLELQEKGLKRLDLFRWETAAGKTLDVYNQVIKL